MHHTLGFNAVFYGMGFLSAVAFLVALLLLPKEKEVRRTDTTTTEKIETKKKLWGLGSFSNTVLREQAS